MRCAPAGPRLGSPRSAGRCASAARNTNGAVPYPSTIGLFRRRSTPDDSALQATLADLAASFTISATGEGSPIPEGGLDYSLASLAHVDTVLGNYHDEAVPIPEAVFQMACGYVLETLRRLYGGHYERDTTPMAYVLVVGEPACRVRLPVTRKVAGRVQLGSEDSIAFYAAGVAPALTRGVDATII